MQVVICPGIHPPELTDAFVRSLPPLPLAPLVFPTPELAYSGPHILAFLGQQLAQTHCVTHFPQPEYNGLPVATPPMIWIGFSAGVVGAIGAAHLWQRLGGQVVALIAFDGWGVPLFASFPIYRLSHDAFTHWSSAWLGAGQTSFYAEPEVGHLDLWRSPHQVCGWAVQPTGYTYTTAAQYVADLLQQKADR